MEGSALKYLLDTAPWLNGITMPEVLPLRIRLLLSTVEKKGLCSVSLLETAILRRIGRFTFDGTLTDFFRAGISKDVSLLEFTLAIAAKTNDLPNEFPGDPFDRTIVATAAAHDLILVTADIAIRDARACKVEYYPFKNRNDRGKR